MQVSLENIGKRFVRHWVFKDINQQLPSGSRSCILGRNGSGKSTLLKIISGHLSPTAGVVRYELDNAEVSREDIYHHVSYCAPYVSLPGDLTLRELLEFQSKLKPMDHSVEEIMAICKLDQHASKQIKNFSSGMQQRAKLAIALLSKSSLVILDEPTSNLDETGISWFQDMLSRTSDNKTVVIGSNHNAQETAGCEHLLDLGTGATSE